MKGFLGALDQGTTSTRFIIFDAGGRALGSHQLEHRQILPQPGWVEHDPLEIVAAAEEVMRVALKKARLDPGDLDAIGITNQRETTVVWNPKTGDPWCNALVWQDTRTDRIMRQIEASGGGDTIRRKAGLPPATYFSAGKIRWIFDHVKGVREAAARGEALFGTIDSWLTWRLTGGRDGGVHVTDVTNASRTMLMDLHTLDWDAELLRLFNLPREILPEIRPSSDPNSSAVYSPPGASREIPIAGAVGDQQAATLGQVCLRPGEAKNTYGTGNFMLMNTGTEVVASRRGLLSTVCYQLGSAAPVYALEGSIAVTGSAVQWLRDQIGLIETAAEIEELALSVEDNGGIYFVPAFSGLFAPYWRSDARGVIAGLSRFNNRGHLARATLESICYQTRDVLDAMTRDSGVRLELLKVDGGATVNNTLMQLQADILGVTVVRPKVIETTALGAAYAAGLAVGLWKHADELRENWQADRQWQPTWTEEERESGYAGWKKAVERSFDWVAD